MHIQIAFSLPSYYGKINYCPPHVSLAPLSNSSAIVKQNGWNKFWRCCLVIRREQTNVSILVYQTFDTCQNLFIDRLFKPVTSHLNCIISLTPILQFFVDDRKDQENKQAVLKAVQNLEREHDTNEENSLISTRLPPGQPLPSRWVEFLSSIVYWTSKSK